MDTLGKIQQNRRNFIKNAFLATIGFSVFTRCASDDFINELCGSADNLVKDPNDYLRLPAGFSYKIISKAGQEMTDGFFVPGRPDGMGTFSGSTSDEVIIVMNHENSPSPSRNGAFGNNNELLQQLSSNQLYDAGGMNRPGLGGTTTMRYNEATQEVESHHLSLAGTYRNCAGGITPWGSWLTCEEDVTKAGGGAEKDHGFVFEVPANQSGLINPVAIEAMGRFNHEAVAVDPNTSIVYMTEDRHDRLIYRFIPNVPEVLSQGGRLQVLAIKDKNRFDTRNWDSTTIELNIEEEVVWIDIDNPLAPEDNLRYRGYDNGAARFARGEGMWFGDNEIYFACTNGGRARTGQIFKYILSPEEGSETAQPVTGKLILHIESSNAGVLNMCDNLTIAPWGDLFVCEDNGRGNRILQIKQNGDIVAFGCNQSSDSEFAGVVFSPSGNTLFVNIQENGDTLAITGSWETLY